MAEPKKHSTKAQRIITLLSTGPRHGAELQRASRMMVGTFYPLIMRLETAGYVQSEWETPEPHADGRPRRRIYSLTDLGADCSERNAP